jgi:hypothetical protein
VRQALVDMVDETDPRIEKWDAICMRNAVAAG